MEKLNFLKFFFEKVFPFKNKLDSAEIISVLFMSLSIFGTFAKKVKKSKDFGGAIL